MATDANPCISEIILGAWGCGVFKQDPEIVANLFDKYFDETTFERVTYAIPAGKNFDVFNRVIKGGYDYGKHGMGKRRRIQFC